MGRYDAIYARQSADKIDSISIESQIEFCKYEVRGGKYKVFCDKGFSGKNTERPQFQDMLGAIKRGEISRVIVYKLDRISRSILDFSNMLEQFQEYGVEFLSCSEKFDTASPMGRAMLNVCVVFAQLERETIQQRVYDAYTSRSRKGFYMGGRVPYGYKLKPHIIDGKRTSCYEINPPEAEVVNLIFSMYAEPNTSLGDVAKKLKEIGIVNTKTKDGSWDRARISQMIKNPIYARADLDIYRFFKKQGAVLHNAPDDFIGINGCYLYEERGVGDKKTILSGQNVVLAPHEGIVPSDIWIRARLKCLNNKQAAKRYKAKNSWLSGKVKCGKCGYALVVKKAKNKADMYFICSRHLQSSLCEGVGGILTEGLEQYIINQVEEKIGAFKSILKKSEYVTNPKIGELEIKIEQIQYEIDVLIDKLSFADGALMDYINKKVAVLHEKKNELKRRLLEIETSENAMDTVKKDEYTGYFKTLSFEDKSKILSVLIDSIFINDKEIKINWKV